MIRILMVLLLFAGSVQAQSVEYNFFKPVTVREYENGELVETRESNTFNFRFVTSTIMEMRYGTGEPIVMEYDHFEKAPITYTINDVRYKKEGNCYYFRANSIHTFELILVYHTEVHCNFTIIFYEKGEKRMSFAGEFLMIPMKK